MFPLPPAGAAPGDFLDFVLDVRLHLWSRGRRRLLLADALDARSSERALHELRRSRSDAKDSELAAVVARGLLA
jgi:hypothetical protein